MVDILTLQASIHGEVARLTRNEAASLTPGAATGLYLAVAAAVCSYHKTRIEELDHAAIRRSRVVVLASSQNPYTVSARQVGIELIQVEGGSEVLVATVTGETVAVLHALVGQDDGPSTLVESRAIAHEAGIPLIVDAAVQIPPVRNLWEIPSSGADAVIFSGGKALGAPHSTGLLVGRAAFIKWIETLGFPRHGFDRMFKMGRDQLVGFLAALEEVPARDEPAWLATREQQVRRVVDVFSDPPFCDVSRGFPNVAGQPVPTRSCDLSRTQWTPVASPSNSERVTSSIAVGRIPGYSDQADGFTINPLALPRRGRRPRDLRDADSI